MERIIVLGGTGYLGKRLIKKLNKKYEFFCITKNITKNDGNIKYISENCFHGIDADIYLNLSCKYLNNDYNYNDIIESNYNFPYRIFEFVKDRNIKKFITIGTGLPDDFNIYCKSKHDFLEKIKDELKLDNEKKIINVRLENFYGELEPLDRFIPSTIQKLKNNEDVFLTSGEQKRDFIYIGDVVNAIIKLIETDDLPHFLDIPLGTGENVSIKELVTYLKYIINSNSVLHFGSIQKRPNECDTIADISLLKKYGIKIQYDYKNGLKKVV